MGTITIDADQQHYQDSWTKLRKRPIKINIYTKNEASIVRKLGITEILNFLKFLKLQMWVLYKLIEWFTQVIKLYQNSSLQYQ